MMNMKKYSPVHYIMSERQDLSLKTEHGQLVVYEPGWYVWDQDRTYRHGPFVTKTEAEESGLNYAKTI